MYKKEKRTFVEKLKESLPKALLGLLLIGILANNTTGTISAQKPPFKDAVFYPPQSFSSNELAKLRSTRQNPAFVPVGSLPKEPNMQINGLTYYAAGTVALTVIEVQNSDPNSPNRWTDQARQLLESELAEMERSWADDAPSSARLTFENNVLEIEIPYEPLDHPYLDDYIWVQMVLAKLGYSATDYSAPAQFNSATRDKFGANWGTTIFVPAGDRYPGYAYLNGPYAMVPQGAAGWGSQYFGEVAGHELGHLLGASDQYPGSVPCSVTSGYLSGANRNSLQKDGMCLPHQPSRMDDPMFPHMDRPYGAAQIGWQNKTNPSLIDVVYTFPVITATVGSKMIFGGYDQGFPSLRFPATSINRIKSIEYLGSDGIYHSIPTDGLPIGTRTIKAVNDVGNFTITTFDAKGNVISTPPVQTFFPIILGR